jgi:hypothetical protein
VDSRSEASARRGTCTPDASEPETDAGHKGSLMGDAAGIERMRPLRFSPCGLGRDPALPMVRVFRHPGAVDNENDPGYEVRGCGNVRPSLHTNLSRASIMCMYDVRENHKDPSDDEPHSP